MPNRRSTDALFFGLGVHADLVFPKPVTPMPLWRIAMSSDLGGRAQADEPSRTDLDRREREATERDQRADERDSALDEREAITAAREAQETDRELQAQQILAGAAGRDEDADARDVIAADRDEVASRDAFVSERGDYGAALMARRSAALDRLDSKDDRTCSARDRANLTEVDPAAS